MMNKRRPHERRRNKDIEPTTMPISTALLGLLFSTTDSLTGHWGSCKLGMPPQTLLPATENALALLKTPVTGTEPSKLL
jgi:hypothetical protein